VQRIRRLGPGDEPLLAELNLRDAEFGLSADGGALEPLAPSDARALLADRDVLLWAAEDDLGPAGFLLALTLPLRHAPGRELLLYEIGVRRDVRRQGIGRALCGRMRDLMREKGIETVWVLADNPVAADFYAAMGFRRKSGMQAYMEMEVPASGPW